MKCCTKCILNEYMPFIVFDKEGKCNYCREQEIIQSNESFNLYPDKEIFKKILDRNRGIGKYDCVVACSGGKDSTGALYVVKRIYKLNPLVVTFSNGFLADGMTENVQMAVDTLGLDWRIYHYNEIKKGVEYFIRSEFRKKISLCDACQIFTSPIKVATEIAKQENINIVFTGSTIAQRIGTLTKSRIIPAHQQYSNRYRTIMNDLRSYLMKFPELKNILSDQANPKSIIVTSPWHYIDQEKIQLNSILASLGWKQIKQSFPKNSTNCNLSYLDAYLARKYKIANYDITYSRLIRLNKLSRKKATDRFMMRIPNSMINKLLGELNSSINEI